jgi:hypothetical protein
MWKMYWRARLCRFAVTGINVGQLGSASCSTMKKTSTQWVDGGSTVGPASSSVASAGPDISDKLKDAVVGGLGKGLDSAMDGWVMPSWEVIH